MTIDNIFSVRIIDLHGTSFRSHIALYISLFLHCARLAGEAFNVFQYQFGCLVGELSALFQPGMWY